MYGHARCRARGRRIRLGASALEAVAGGVDVDAHRRDQPPLALRASSLEARLSACAVNLLEPAGHEPVLSATTALWSVDLGGDAQRLSWTWQRRREPNGEHVQRVSVSRKL